MKDLTRIEAVQKKLVALADLRLAAAERICRELVDNQTQLRSYIGQHESLGQPLAKAALKAARDIDRRLMQAERLTAWQKNHRDGLKRREHTASAVRDAEVVVARRAAEDQDLTEIMEAWFARSRASLP